MAELTELEQVLPQEIEKRSFEIITQELGDRVLDEKQAPVIKRVIHTTADFDYADNLVFSPTCGTGMAAIQGRHAYHHRTPIWENPVSTKSDWQTMAARYTASWQTRTWQKRPGNMALPEPVPAWIRLQDWV